MRLSIRHATTYAYDLPAKSVIQVLRLTPRNHEGQRVEFWRIEVDGDAQLMPSEDAFGNIVHTFTAHGPVDRLGIVAEGLVSTFDMGGVVRNGAERFPPALYLRETPLTAPNADIAAFAADAIKNGGTEISRLHDLMLAVKARLIYDVDPTHSATSAQDCFALGRGVCQDFAQVFIAAARSLGIPARYVGGHFHRSDTIEQEAGHAWAEAYVQDLGWVSFDPTNGVSSSEAYVRVAVGLDYLGAAPIRGTQVGGAGEKMRVEVLIAPSTRRC